MGRVSLASPPFSPVTNKRGDVLPGRTIRHKTIAGADATVYDAETGGSPASALQTTDADGYLPANRWVNGGSYLQHDERTGKDRRVDAVAGSVESKVTGYSQVEAFIGITANPTDAIEAAIVDATAANTRAGVVDCGQGRTYTLTSRALRFAAGYVGLKFRLNGATITGSTATKGRVIDFWQTAAYQTTQNIDIEGPGTIDGANVTDASNQGVIGNLIDGAWALRGNVSNVSIRKLTFTNITTATGAESRQVISIGSNHLAAGETLTTLQDILIEDCDLTHGGNVGVAVLGSGAATVNVLCDRITVRRCKMDSGVVPTTFHVAACIQIGGTGYGGTYTVEGCQGANSADVGIELDAPQTALVSNTTMTDCFNGEFFATNFATPAQPSAQVATFRNCHARVVGLNPVVGTGSAYGFLPGASTAPTFGHVILEGCSFRSASANHVVGGQAIRADTAIAKLTIRDFTLTAEAINYAPGVAATPSLVFIRPTVLSRVVIDGLHMKLAGTVNANVTTSWVRYSGGSGVATNFDIQNVTAEGNLAGASNGSNILVELGADSGTMSGKIRGFRLLSWAGGDTLPKRIRIATTATLTIGRIHIAECDFLSSMGGFEVNFLDTTNRAKVSMDKGITWGSNIGNPPTVASAATLSIPPVPMVLISGTTNITSISACPPDTVVAFKFAGVLTLTNGSNLKLGADIVTAADLTVALSCDGTNWYPAATERILTGTATWDPASVASDLTGSTTWDPASLVNGASERKSVTVTGAAVGDPAFAGLSTIAATGWDITAAVIATNTVEVKITNNTGGTVDLASGTVKAIVQKATQVTTTVTVTGAAVGDPVAVGFSNDLQGMRLTGYVSAADTVTVVLRNSTGAALDLASGTLKARVLKR